MTTEPRDIDDRVRLAHANYQEARPKSYAEHQRALNVMPGGNTRSVLNFDPFPFRVDNADGKTLVDIDGYDYIDLCGNYSAGLLGHSPQLVRDAIVEALSGGWALGAMHRVETEVAELICARFESIERVRFTNSGTEANLMAIGLALHHTGRSIVGVFDQGYHGGVLSFGAVGDGPHNLLNVPHQFVVAPFDDTNGLDDLFAQPDLGCVLVETVQGSGGCRPASIGFLEELRRRCDESGTVLIFDEVMTSRLAFGGGQQRCGVMPDLTTLGKYLGGGMTFGAFGGRRVIMDEFDPAKGGQLSQAGTFNNNVVSMAGAKATLKFGITKDQIDATNDRGDCFRDNLNSAFERHGRVCWATGVGSMVCVHADDDRVIDLLFHHALDQGFYISRRGFMALSIALTDEDLSTFVDLVEAWVCDVFCGFNHR